MIYILSGNNTKQKRAFLSTLAKDREQIVLSEAQVSREILFGYAENKSLFGSSPVVVIENSISRNLVALSAEDLSVLKDSPTLFVFLEDKILAADEKKYKKYATIEKFDEKKTSEVSKTNPFALTDAFARRDKIGAWILYRDQIEKGAEPEPISGLLFWKVKMMLLNGTEVFSVDELKRQSSEIVSLYHRAHRGECDFIVGLEQFILSSLSK